MILPEINEPQRYIGLYVVDFGDHCSAGLRTEEVAELLEDDTDETLSVYKIYNAYPDGRLALTGVSREIFQVESGMLFYAPDEATARNDFDRLCRLAGSMAPPSRAKAHLASDNNDGFVTALIYPAEYDDLFSRWLLEGDYRTAGPVRGGSAAVSGFYDCQVHILERKQFWPEQSVKLLQGDALRQATRKALAR